MRRVSCAFGNVCLCLLLIARVVYEERSAAMQSLCLTFALSKLALTSLVLVLATAPHCTGRLIEKRSTGQQIKTIVSLFLAWTVFALSPESLM